MIECQQAPKRRFSKLTFPIIPNTILRLGKDSDPSGVEWTPIDTICPFDQPPDRTGFSFDGRDQAV
jgi:hypothetical protein